MSGQKKIFVFTVTGDQGSSVAQFLAKTGECEVIGLTRNPDGAKAKELAKLGVKVVKGDMEDVSSYEPYLQGIYGAFVNADFWAKYFTNGMDGPAAGEYEFGLSSKAIEAAAKAGAQHIIYSTLDEVPYVPHFHYKQEVSKWAAKQGYPVTNLYVGHYISNLTKFPDILKDNGDGSVSLNLPATDDTPISNIAIEQTGGWVTAIFKDPKKYIGARVDAIGEIVTLAEWAKEVSGIIGKPVKTLGHSPSLYDNPKSLAEYGVPDEMVVNYKGFYEKHAKWDLKQAKEIYPEAWDTKAWAQATNGLDKFKA